MRYLSALVVSLALASMLVACQAGNESGSGSLKVGDCYSLGNSVDANDDNIVIYSVVDCASTHDGEVFSVFDYPNASGWPGYEAIGTVQQSRCETDFQSYVGISWEQSMYTINYIAPTESSWASGDQTIKCRLEDASSGKLTGSARGTRK